jgi:N-acetylglucosamine-6-phosphate deacetylase
VLILTNGKVYLDGAWKTGLDLLVKEGKIVDIKPQGTQKEGKVVDAQGGYITPGFIDIHIHGSNGSDVMDAQTSSLENISNFLAGNGTTSWLATTMTVSPDKIRNAMKTVADYMEDESQKGAQILGVHMEGPFLSPLAKGAHDENYIAPPTKEIYSRMTEGIPDIVRLITMAPETEGALEFAKYLQERNITASIGHTRATYEQCRDALNCGMNHVCHFYNAMSALNHREPGAVGAILENDNATIELIADLIHLHPAAIRLAVQVKGRDRTVLITDAMAATGLKDGEYELGGLPVYVKNGEARQEDGTLAGSTLTQDRALTNMIKIGIPSEDVIAMLTETPARQIGVNTFKGKLQKGFDADINILDNEFKVKSTYIKGIEYIAK